MSSTGAKTKFNDLNNSHLLTIIKMLSRFDLDRVKPALDSLSNELLKRLSTAPRLLLNEYSFEEIATIIKSKKTKEFFKVGGGNVVRIQVMALISAPSALVVVTATVTPRFSVASLHALQSRINLPPHFLVKGYLKRRK